MKRVLHVNFLQRLTSVAQCSLVLCLVFVRRRNILRWLTHPYPAARPCSLFGEQRKKSARLAMRALPVHQSVDFLGVIDRSWARQSVSIECAAARRLGAVSPQYFT